MSKIAKKATAAQKKAKKEAKIEHLEKYMWVFMNGKQVRVKRPPTIDGIPQGEWIAQNADPIGLHQNEMWDVLDARGSEDNDGF